MHAARTWCSAWLSLLSPEKHAGCSPSSRTLTAALMSFADLARAPRLGRGAGVVGTCTYASLLSMLVSLCSSHYCGVPQRLWRRLECMVMAGARAVHKAGNDPSSLAC